MKRHWLSIVAMTGILLSGAAQAAAASPAMDGGTTATLKDAKGKSVGTATLTQAPNGVLIHVEFTGLPAGTHALHLHETGKCDGPDFKSAGGHFNPEKKHHGFLAAGGSHAGDLPNFEAPADGKVTVDAFDSHVTLEKGKDNSLMKVGGTAIVVHAKKDDYKSDPAGDAGDRVACGVIGQ